MAEQGAWYNLGSRKLKSLRVASFPDVGAALRNLPARRPEGAVDVLLVNPPAPEEGSWIGNPHGLGRRSQANIAWPPVSLAQLAAMLHPDYHVEVVDAVATRMSWPEFECLLRQKQPRYYLTQMTAPPLTNTMYGVFLARSLGARTIAFGARITPMTREIMQRFPALDFVLRGEPELTLRELLDTLEVAAGRWRVQDGRLHRADGHVADQEGCIGKLFRDTDAGWRPAWLGEGQEPAGEPLATIKGLAWRCGVEIEVNSDRPFIASLDDLPMPMHHLLPLERYRMPTGEGPYACVVTGRGCTAGCKYCIKHVTYQYSVRVRSPENIVQELWRLHDLGIHHVHMEADLFTVSRDQVVGICQLILEQGLRVRWTCNSRVDYVDEDMLRLMGRAGCSMIAWGIESASEDILRRARRGTYADRLELTLRWAMAAGIGNWGCFMIGLPGETEQTIRQTIELAKKLPLDLALFYIATPYPGTPFFFDVVQNGWFRPGAAWEVVDLDRPSMLDYQETGLTAERLEYWQRRATCEWALRPGPLWTTLRRLRSWEGLKSALDMGLRILTYPRT